MTDAEPLLAFKRALAWGILLVRDSRTKALPELDDQAFMTVSENALVILVHHAADVSVDDVPADEIAPEAEVAVRIYADRPSVSTLSFEAVVSVPSGSLRIGDAEHDQLLDIGPGRWHIRVVCRPRDDADEVDLWLSPAG